MQERFVEVNGGCFAGRLLGVGGIIFSQRGIM